MARLLLFMGTMRPARFALALCLAGGLTTSTAVAAPITITFDELDKIDVGHELSNQYEDIGVLFEPNAFAGPGGPSDFWATNTDMTIVSSTGGDVGGDLGAPPLASGNVLRSNNAWFFTENGDPSFRATFDGGITSLSATFAGILGLYANSTQLIAYHETTQVGSATASSGDAQQVLTVSSDMPITSVVFIPGDHFNDFVVVDNITFELIAVPEPASLSLLALGVAAATRSRRRR